MIPDGWALSPAHPRFVQGAARRVSPKRSPMPMLRLHRYSQTLVAASLLLIAAGGLVTSTGSGLAVPDWPNSYGYFMFSFPLSKMVGGIFYEHGHRLIASIVGIMTMVLAVWVSRVEPRQWVRRLGWSALAAVVMQGLLGGITVLFFLPTPVSVSHAGLAPIFFTLVVAMAVFNSKGWINHYHRDERTSESVAADRRLRSLAVALPAIIYLQILAGATMRHTGAGLAIPDFPLAFGRIVPPMWDASIAIHFAHRVGAVVAVLVVAAVAARVLKRHRDRGELVRPAVLLIAIVGIQVTLGAWTVWSERQVAINTAHVATGAVLLVTSVVLGLRVHRDRFADASALRPVPEKDSSLDTAAWTPQGSEGTGT